jgi:hypothetical protein
MAQQALELGIDHLEALDLLLWTASGINASTLLKTSESSVSRKSRDCTKFFNLELIRISGRISLSGDLSPLQSARSFLQSLRLSGIRPLRIHANDCTIHGKLISSHETQHFISHLDSDMEISKLTELMHHRVIDVIIINNDNKHLTTPSEIVHLPVETFCGSTNVTLHVWSHPKIYGCDHFRQVMDVVRQP